MTITLHFILQLTLNPSQEDRDSDLSKFICQADGMVSAYTYVTAVSYYLSLSHCIIQSVTEFQPKNKVAGWVYHVFPNIGGLIFVIIAAS